MEAIESFIVLLEPFRDCFTKPTYSILVTILVGWVLSHRRRYITDAIITTGSTRQGPHSNFHRFFSQAAWSLDQVSWTLTLLIVRTFVPWGVIVIAVDDTLRRKRGLSLFGAGMHYDPLLSSRGKKVVNWGHCWVVVSIVVGNLPWAPGKFSSLPILYSLLVLWFHCEGQHSLRFPDRPWYRHQRFPSFGDMLTTLRRESLAKQIRRVLKNTGVDETQLTQLVELLTLAG